MTSIPTQTTPQHRGARLTSLTGRLTLVALVVFLIVVGLAALIILNMVATQRTTLLLTDYQTEEIRLAGAYHTSLQRWMTEIAVYALSGDQKAFEEAIKALERVATVQSTWYTLEETSVPVSLPEHDHIDLLEEQDTLLERAQQLSQEVARSEQVNVSDVLEEITELEEQRAELAATADSAVSELQVVIDNQIAQASQTVLVTIVGAVIGILFLIAGALWFVQRQIVRPVQGLAQAAEAVVDGNLDLSVTVTSQDEIGILQRTFNRMVATLQQQTNDLEAQYHQAITARDEATVAQDQIVEQLIMLQEQQRTINELSVPLLPLSKETLVLPLIGTVDSRRVQQVMETLLEGVAQHRTKLVIMDITGVAVVDTQVAQAFIQIAQAVQLLGAQVILTGVQPQIAHTIVNLGLDLGELQTRSSLQAGVVTALEKNGLGQHAWSSTIHQYKS